MAIHEPQLIFYTPSQVVTTPVLNSYPGRSVAGTTAADIMPVHDRRCPSRKFIPIMVGPGRATHHSQDRPLADLISCIASLIKSA